MQHRKSTAKKLYSRIAAISQHFRSLLTANVQFAVCFKMAVQPFKAFCSILQLCGSFRQLSEALLDSCKVAAYGCKICFSDKFSTVQ